MTSVKTVQPLINKLMKLDSHANRAIGDYSHASSHTDRVRLTKGNVNKALKQEGNKLDTMLEVLSEPDNRQELVKSIESLGVRSGVHGGFSCLMSGRYIQTLINDLSVCRAAIRFGTNPEYGRNRGAEIVKQLADLGIECDPIQV